MNFARVKRSEIPPSHVSVTHERSLKKYGKRHDRQFKRDNFASVHALCRDCEGKETSFLCSFCLKMRFDDELSFWSEILIKLTTFLIKKLFFCDYKNLRHAFGYFKKQDWNLIKFIFKAFF